MQGVEYCRLNVEGWLASFMVMRGWFIVRRRGGYCQAAVVGPGYTLAERLRICHGDS